MARVLVIAGLSAAAIGFVGKNLISHMPRMTSKLQEVIRKNTKSSMTQFYSGGFERNMNRREAARILGISPNASCTKVKEAYKRIMLLNHPDRGGSPYIAAKINQAKDIMDKPQ